MSCRVIIALFLLNVTLCARAVAGDPLGIHTVKAGETLASIAEVHYGDRSYMGIILRYNDVPHERFLTIGRQLKVPPIDSILRTEGISSIAPEAADEIARAWQEYRVLCPHLFEAFQRVPDRHDSLIVRFPDTLKPDLESIAKRLDRAANALNRPLPGASGIPKMTIAAIRRGAEILRTMATEGCDGEGYCMMIVDQQIAGMLADAMIWARQGFK